MKLKIFKKIIALTYLITFLFGLFIPLSKSFAQIPSAGTLTLSTNSVNIGQPATITTALTGVTDPNLKAGGQIVLFYSTASNNYTFSNSSTSKNPTCTMPALQGQTAQSCSITFTASVAGTFHINAVIFASQADYNVYLLANYQSGALPTNQIANINIITTDVVVADRNPSTDTTYTPLAPLPGEPASINTDAGCTIDPTTGNKTNCTNPCPFGTYLNVVIKVVIGFAAVLAMIMIVMGGIEYMTAELVSGKEEGRERITHAVLGLLLALSAYLILNTINPQLLSACLDKLPQATITISPEQALMIKNISGGGNCVVVTDTNSACSQDKLATIFTDTTNATAPFNTNAAQASAICQLESNAVVDAPTPNGTGTSKTIDFCKNDKTIFSFGLFQINLLANGSSITDSQGENCGGLFVRGDGSSIQNGNYIISDSSAPGGYSYDCKLSDVSVQTKYTNCKNYLLNPTNNIAFAAKLYEQYGWTPTWSTYNSCKNKF